MSLRISLPTCGNPHWGIMAPLTFLSPSDIQSIQDATLRILSETGIRLTHPGARDLLDGAGATVLEEKVLLPPAVVNAALKLCPTTFTLKGRGGGSVKPGNGELHWHNLGGAPDVYESGGNLRRPATIADVQKAAHLLDALPNCTDITPFFTPQDVPGEIISLAMYRHTLPFTIQTCSRSWCPERRRSSLAGSVG